MAMVSVIIPVYNVEQYLRECLDSVVNQTLGDIEIICIDDGSTDTSGDICEEYAAKDSRMTVIHVENHGLAYARNAGIKNAGGEYLYFLDSDDYIEPDTLEAYYNLAKKNNLQALRSNYAVLDMKRNQIRNFANISIDESKVYAGKVLLDEVVNQPFYPYGCWFAERAFICENELLFPNGLYFEDTVFTLDLLCSADRVMCINEHKYIYRQRENSIMSMNKSIKHIISMLKVITTNMQHLNNCEDKYIMAVYMYIQKNVKFFLSLLSELNISIDFDEFDKKLLNVFEKIVYDAYTINMKTIFSFFDKIKTAENLYIYGAGVAGREMIDFLDKRNIDITAVLVTDKSKNRSRVYSYSVYEPTEVDDKDALVLIAVKNHDKEIAENLKTLGFTNYISVV